ncbi:MAG TPA: hypothetical protein VK587_08995, partial [bacterium]|nr:hypothetical protein [bacterium]
PDAGFAAAAARAGLTLSTVVRRIIADLSGNAAAGRAEYPGPRTRPRERVFPHGAILGSVSELSR